MIEPVSAHRRRLDLWSGIASLSSAALGGLGALVGVCCIGPVGITLFGVSGAVALARLAPAQPWLVGVATALASYVFWRLYIRRWITGTEVPGVRASQHVLFWASVVLIAVASIGDRLAGFVS